jgi:signal transduction histidine kinase/CheY-like chemotaxis protein
MPRVSPLLPPLRWITIVAIAGTSITLIVDLTGVEGPWRVAALILAVIALGCLFAVLRLVNDEIEASSESARSAVTAAAAVTSQADEQVAKFETLRNELEEYRRLQAELVTAKQDAEAATRAKGEFLATMSHEVRTPLNGIIPMLDLLQSSKLALDQREMLSTALQSARQLLRIVDDILDYSKLEANALQLESVGLNLREMLDSVIRLLERQAQSKGLRLTLHIAPEVRMAFRGDPVRLRQIISNLIGNALKFTERGSITVHVSRIKETRTHHELRFEVRDTGVGISPEAASKLFSAFSQADAWTTRVYGGTGLGLAICKRIVDLMGGRIGVDSELGRGSTFWFEIPMLKASSEIEGPRTGMQGARMLVLTAEPALQRKLNASLSQSGSNPVFVENTQEALTQLRASLAAPTRGFDVLIVDLASIKHTVVALHRNLINMDGVERLRILFLEGPDPVPADAKALPNSFVMTRVLAETDIRPKLTEMMAGEAISTAGRESRAAVSLAPMHDHGSDQPAPVSQGPVPFVPIKGKLLLVEDNPVNLLVAQRLISLTGMTCETAENGEQALEKMARGKYDIVLMDCQMPVMDGYTATRTWREHEAESQLQPLPIIAMTANAMAGDRQKCLDAGMDDYLSKPVSREHLDITLRRWLEMPSRLRRSGSPHEAEVPAVEMPVPVPVQEIPIESPVAPVPSAATPFVFELSADTLAAADALARMRPTTSSPDPAPVAAPVPAVAPPAPVAAPVSVAAPASPATPVAAAPAVTDRPPRPALDSEIIEDLWSAMGDSFSQLVDVFLEDAPSHLAKLDQAAAKGDIAGLVGPAHALKSSSANLGAMQVSAIAKHIEHGARDKTLTDAVDVVARLNREFKRAEIELRVLLH